MVENVEMRPRVERSQGQKENIGKHLHLDLRREDARWQELPCLTKVWLVSRRISQPSTIMRSIARFFLIFSVSLTSSCMILGTEGLLIIFVMLDGAPALPVNAFLISYLFY